MLQSMKVSTDQLLNMLLERTQDVYCQLYRLLNKWLIDNKDASQDVDLRPHYIYITQFANRIESVLYMLSNGDAEEKAKFIVTKAKEVDDLERRIIEFNTRNRSSSDCCGI